MSATRLAVAAAVLAFASSARAETKPAAETALTVFTNELAYGSFLVEEFSKRFPYKVVHRVLRYNAGQDETFGAFENEDAALRADVLLTCQEPSLASILEAGWAARLDDLPNWKRDGRPLIDDPRYAYFLGAPHVIVYNKELVSASKAPKTYAELLAPAWQDKVVLRDPTHGNSGAFLVDFIRHADGDLSWYSKLAANGAYMATSGKRVHELVASGERPVGLSRDVEFLSVGDGWRQKLAWRFVEGEIPFQFQLGLVNAAAPHPEAARTFMNWVLSEEAEKLLLERGFSVGERRRSQLAGRKVWFMDVKAAKPNHLSRIHEATRRLRAGGALTDDEKPRPASASR